ncbi:serine protein kinase Sky1 [Metarhizium acridum CQMa 102]|uniref:non-specific serine/threonine protein kinase n=1 Tax=Metarhizium acridum (strain CQMa 102) TaxID=655827 RepID=E9DT46_METAQ|nr:serine protein kinase Sky1 [Metarhizium acridum CQMa 102]EFY93145.1 serine protein kinase Sky1 [Metarhizium acridum CQMa 102]
MGYGVYSTVWLAFDLELKQHVALKILTADSFGQGYDTFELGILRRIRAQNSSNPGATHILGPLDNFEHNGPNGNHVCLVFKAMGPDMSKYRRLFPKLRIPLPLMKVISKQLLLALSYLHDTCRVIHTGQSARVMRKTANMAPSFLSLSPDRDSRYQASEHPDRNFGHQQNVPASTV